MANQEQIGADIGLEGTEFETMSLSQIQAYKDSLSDEEQREFERVLTESYDAKNKQLDSKLAEAQGRADTGTPQGRYAGGMYVAANPLEHLGNALRGHQGRKDVEDIRGQQAQVSNDQQAGRQATMAAISHQPQQIQPQQQPIPGGGNALGMLQDQAVMQNTLPKTSADALRRYL